MIRGSRLIAPIALAGLALASLLLTFRAQPVRTPEQARLSTDYYFRDADIALVGEGGRAEFLVDAGSANLGLDNESLMLERVTIRRQAPRPWSLTADAASLSNDGADITAEDNVRLTFGPSGKWVAEARRARVRVDDLSLTLTDDFTIHRPDAGPEGSAISGQHVVLIPETMDVRTDQTVRLRVGGVEFEGKGLKAKIGEHLIKLDQDVRLLRNE